MDITERPHFAIFEGPNARVCYLTSSLEDTVAAVDALLGGGVHEALETSTPYRGLLLTGPAGRMLAPIQARSREGTALVALAVEVPGVLEGRPALVHGSRVHIAYKVGPDLLF